jgi:hypothetical protein
VSALPAAFPPAALPRPPHPATRHPTRRDLVDFWRSVIVEFRKVASACRGVGSAVRLGVTVLVIVLGLGAG